MLNTGVYFSYHPGTRSRRLQNHISKASTCLSLLWTSLILVRMNMKELPHTPVSPRRQVYLSLPPSLIMYRRWFKCVTLSNAIEFKRIDWSSFILIIITLVSSMYSMVRIFRCMSSTFQRLFAFLPHCWQYRDVIGVPRVKHCKSVKWLKCGKINLVVTFLFSRSLQSKDMHAFIMAA